ncbi:MAG: hypothetical protein AAB497_01055 [Patescibacteria group bacterium]
MKKISRQQGFAKVIFLAIVIIGGLAYFNIDLRAILGTIFENPIVQKVWHIFVVAWATYIKPLFVYLWTSIAGLFK